MLPRAARAKSAQDGVESCSLPSTLFTSIVRKGEGVIVMVQNVKGRRGSKETWEFSYLQTGQKYYPRASGMEQWFALLRGLCQCSVPWPATDDGGDAKSSCIKVPALRTGHSE